MLSLPSLCHHSRSRPDLISQGLDQELLSYSVSVNFALKAGSEHFSGAPTLTQLRNNCGEQECKSTSLSICKKHKVRKQSREKGGHFIKPQALPLPFQWPFGQEILRIIYQEFLVEKACCSMIQGERESYILWGWDSIFEHAFKGSDLRPALPYLQRAKKPMPCSHPVQHPLVPGGPGLVSLGTLCTKLAWGVPENLKFTWFKKERWRGTLGMELSLKSLCVTHVIEVEKEIVWHTFLKLLSSRNEKKNPLLCLIHFSLSDYYLLLCIQNRKLSRLWNPKEIEKIVRQGTEEMLNPLANCVSLHTVLNIPGLIICSLF